MAFGVATNNIFSLLDEENEDPQDLANKVSAHSEKPKGKEESAKPKEVARTAGVGSVLVSHLYSCLLIR